jgi:hypothetical protein
VEVLCSYSTLPLYAIVTHVSWPARKSSHDLVICGYLNHTT